MTELLVEKLSFVQSGRIYLKEVNLELQAGTVLALKAAPKVTGRSLLQVLSGVQAPTEGDARLGGISLREDRWSYRRQVGYMPAEFGSYPRVTAGEFLTSFAQMYGFERQRAARLPQEMMELFDLLPLADCWLTELAPAERARLSLARALLSDPQMLLLDRPFDKLEQLAPRELLPEQNFEQELAREQQEKEEQESIRLVCTEIIRELAGMGKIVIIHTSNPARLSDLAGMVAVLEDGILLPSELVEQISGRLGQQTFVRIQPVLPRQLPQAAYLLSKTEGFSNLRRVGSELVATYDGPLAHARLRIEAKMQAAEIPLRSRQPDGEQVKVRRMRPSRLLYEP